MEPKPRILIVDDTPSARMMNGAILAEDAYVLEYACDATVCMQKLQEFKPDVIISDIVMPGMDGLEMCSAIKKDQRYRNTMVILLSALDKKEDLVRGLESGADEFLSKPVNPGELRARVRSMLRIKKQHDELQIALKLRDDIAHTIIHDMRTPLNVILGSTELLSLNTGGEGRHAKLLERIVKQASRLNSLINDMLMISKIEHGRMLLNRKSFSLDEILAQTLDNYAMMAGASSQKIILEASDEPIPNIYGDADLIVRVFDNLITNALKYSPTGSEIRVCAEYEREEDSVVIEIADQGTGIPLEQRDVIFEKYATLKNAPEGVHQFGLGLYFCKLAIEAHGGSINVEPNEPFGSVFRIVLPVMAALSVV